MHLIYIQEGENDQSIWVIKDLVTSQTLTEFYQYEKLNSWKLNKKGLLVANIEYKKKQKFKVSLLGNFGEVKISKISLN